jgi:polyhydroxyalkanoate synthesis regulator phasin
MPGVSSAQANEIIDQLQEVGRITTTETSNLVNAIACMMVDHQDSNEAAARLCMEITLARARIDDLTSQTGELRNEVLEERNKRQLAECDVKKIMGELHDLNKEFNTSTGRDELIDVSCSSVSSMPCHDPSAKPCLCHSTFRTPSSISRTRSTTAAASG